MKGILSSFWVNIAASLAFAALAGVLTQGALGQPALVAIGVGILAGAILGSVLLGFRMWSRKTPVVQPVDRGAFQVTAQTISGGTIVQSQRIEHVHLESPVVPKSATPPQSPRFVTEGTRVTDSGLEILFSIWNRGEGAIKLIEFSTVQYAYNISTFYYGGRRHVFALKQGASSLWDGESHEIPSGESASFQLGYTFETGPANGRPTIVFGVRGKFHTASGGLQELHSDSVYVLRTHDGDAENEVEAVPLDDLEQLDKPNWYSHSLYATVIENLVDRLEPKRAYVAGLMREDYARGIATLRAAITEVAETPADPSAPPLELNYNQSRKNRARAAIKLPPETREDRRQTAITNQGVIDTLETRLMALVDIQRTAPLTKSQRHDQIEILARLQDLAVEYSNMAFVHVCTSTKRPPRHASSRAGEHSPSPTR